MEIIIDEIEDIEDIAINSFGEVLPPKNDLIALIDADTLVYGSCSALEIKEELLGEEFYSEKEWEDIINDPGYVEEEQAVYRINEDAVVAHTLEKINTILENTGCQDYELHFTIGRASFRYTDVTFTYKANRSEISSKRPPAGLYQAKKAMEKLGKSYLWTEWEADDIVVCKKAKFPDKYLLVALDKDVLYALEGRHFNYYTSTQYNIPMKFFEVTAKEALQHHYKQVLTGDKGDNVIGLDRVGKKTAEKILKNCNTHKECWDKVVAEYEARGRDAIDALINMRLVNMHQLQYVNNELKVILWKPQF